jgi:hypothetical protein
LEVARPIPNPFVGGDQTALPLAGIETRFAVDSSGFCTTHYPRFFDVRYGVETAKADFAKVHLCTGVLTNVVTAADTHP